MQRVLLCLASLAVTISLPLEAQSRCADFVPGPRPQNASRDIVGQDLDTILERGFITFAAYEDFQPWSYEAEGRIQGVDIEIGEMIAQDLGVQARFTLVAAGETLDADLRNWVWKGPIVGGRVANVMLHVPYDSEYACRVEQVVFTGTYHTEEIGIAYRLDAYPEDPPVPAYFRFDTVAVETDSIADFYLSAFPGGQLSRNISHYATTAKAMKALDAGETVAAVGPLAQLEAGLTEALGVHTPPLPGFAVGTWEVGVAVNFRYRPLSYAVGDAITAGLQDGRIAAIFERYGLSHRAPELR